jgi:hypothetical protein
MMKRLSLVLLFASCTVAGFAQSAAPNAPAQRTMVPYRIDVALTEFDGPRKVNTRNYTMNVLGEGAGGNERTGVVKIGNRVPIVASSKEGLPAPVTYMDVGLNVTCRSVQNQAADDNTPMMWCDFEISSLVPHEENPASDAGRPVLRSMRGSSAASTPLGKPVVMTTIDDPGSTKRFQFEVTVNRSK